MESSNISEQKTTKEFTKRYSRTGRHVLADEIRELRFQQSKHAEGNPERQQTLDVHKSEVEKMQQEHVTLIEEIKTLEKEIEDEKEKVWHKVKSFFRTIELEQELQLATTNKKAEELKKNIEERLKIISEIENAISDTSLLEEAKNKVDDFYNEQSELKKSFESEEAKRSIETLSIEHDCVFIHGIPWKSKVGEGTTGENNPILNHGAFGMPEERTAMIMGLQPTISVSAMKEGTREEGLYPFGMILGGGRVLAAHNDDEGTVAETLYYRKTKYDHNPKTLGTSIQPDIDANISKALEAPTHRPHNEFVVEEPEVAGFYINVSILDDATSFSKIQNELKHYPEKFDLPFFALKNGKLYPLGTESSADFEDFTKDNGSIGTFVKNKKERIVVGEKAIPIKNIVEKTKKLSGEEKMALAEQVLEKNPFQIERLADYDSFRAYSTGGSPYVVRPLTGNLGRQGYAWIVRQNESNEKLIERGLRERIEPKKVLNEAREKLLEIKQKIPEAESYKFRKFWSKQIQPSLFALYGFALEAESHGDMETANEARALLEEFGLVAECKQLIDKRVDEQGNFKVLDTDLPSDVRKRMTILSKNK